MMVCRFQLYSFHIKIHASPGYENQVPVETNFYVRSYRYTVDSPWIWYKSFFVCFFYPASIILDLFHPFPFHPLTWVGEQLSLAYQWLTKHFNWSLSFFVMCFPMEFTLLSSLDSAWIYWFMSFAVWDTERMWKHKLVYVHRVEQTTTKINENSGRNTTGD